MSDRQPPKEYRARLSEQPRLSYAQKLQSPLWQKKRLGVLNRANWQCESCGATDLQLSVHHTYYIACCEPWDHPDDILLSLCDYCHKERQAVEQALFVEIARHIARLSVSELRQQPAWTFFVEESTLDYFPAWQREYLRYERDEDGG